MARRGHRDFMSYMLYNFKDSPQDFYYRLRESVRLTETMKIRCRAFPMRYQPILEIDKQRNYVGPKWTAQKRKNFGVLCNGHSTSGQVSCDTMREFEYWFGKTAEEFDVLLSYSMIGELANRKRGGWRMQRANYAKRVTA